MTITAPPPAPLTGTTDSLRSGRLAAWVPWGLLGASLVAMLAVFLIMTGAAGGDFNYGGWLVSSALVYLVVIYVTSSIVEGGRKATDRLVTGVVTAAFLIAMVPLVSVA